MTKLGMRFKTHTEHSAILLLKFKGDNNNNNKKKYRKNLDANRLKSGFIYQEGLWCEVNDDSIG